MARARIIPLLHRLSERLRSQRALLPPYILHVALHGSPPCIQVIRQAALQALGGLHGASARGVDEGCRGVVSQSFVAMGLDSDMVEHWLRAGGDDRVDVDAHERPERESEGCDCGFPWYSRNLNLLTRLRVSPSHQTTTRPSSHGPPSAGSTHSSGKDDTRHWMKRTSGISV